MFRKLLTSAALVIAIGGVAVAADLPSRAVPPLYAPPPAFTWTGFYIGGQIGYDFGQTSPTLLNNPALTFASSVPSFNTSGLIGGAHMGILAQTGIFVYGLEGDIEGGFNKGSTVFGGATFSSREDVESTYRLRFGLGFDRFLAYATGGFAIADINNTVNNPGVGIDSDNHTRFGWTGGGGLEYALTNNWSIRAEYRYTFFGHTDDFLPNSTGNLLATSTKETENSVRAGFSYKFGPPPPAAPVIAKY